MSRAEVSTPEWKAEGELRLRWRSRVTRVTTLPAQRPDLLRALRGERILRRALLARWFINVPYMAASLPSIFFPLFWPCVVHYFLFVKRVKNVSSGRTLLALFTGVAYIVCWMNGVSGTSRIITHGVDIFVLVQRLHWAARVAWAVVTVVIIRHPKPWMRVVGLIGGVTELVVGIPQAVVNAQQLGRSSLFALAPGACLIPIILYVWPGL